MMWRDKINKYIKFDTSILCFCHLFQENNAESLKLSQIIFPKNYLIYYLLETICSFIYTMKK